MTISNPTNSPNSTWTGMVPFEDTALAVTDTGGPGVPVVYLNGSYGSQRHWRRIIAELGPGWRHLTYDERARGRSKRSADYSFEATIRDLDAVLAARRVNRPVVLAGWSYGAAIALHWGTRHPDRIAGAVSVDGAYPYDTFGKGDVSEEHIRRLFRRLGWALPLAHLVGNAAGMSADQHAEINIEIIKILGAGDPVLDRVTFPFLFVVGTGGHFGATDQVMERLRASLDPVLARNPNLQVSARVQSNHETIMRKDFRAIADAVRKVTAIYQRGVS
jgi:pimeloyl-ACP methyl ester carboxylesterase